MFAGLLGLLGVDLGPEVLEASSANEAGYWEHRGIVNLHERLLMELGSSWDDVSRLPEGWWGLDGVAPFRQRLLEMLRRDFGGSALWTLKDPRMCRLLPLWKAILGELGAEPTWVLVTRHPCENILSLETRNGFSWEKSELLWLQHTLDAEAESRDGSRVIVTFDQLLKEREKALETVREAIGVPWPAPPERAAEEMVKFVDPSKRHHRALDAERLTSWTRETYDALLAGAEGRETEMRQRLDAVRGAFEAADGLYAPVLRGRAAELEGRLAQVNARNAELLDSLKELNENYLVTKEKLVAKSHELSVRKEQARRVDRSAGGKLNRLLGRFKPKTPAQAEAIDFPATEGMPEATVIVSAGRDLACTIRCLTALRDQIAGKNVEVIAVGDDATAKRLATWKNLGTVQDGAALTFAEPLNRAAQKARGTLLIFLQDTIAPGQGWFDALTEPLRTRPEVGVVGPQGGILNRDGSIRMLHEGASMEPCEADFCTLACLAVSKNLFFQAGGYDGYYLPVEEASFGLKIRQTNHKILREPRCAISRHGADARFDPQRFESSRRRFMRRWADALAVQP